MKNPHLMIERPNKTLNTYYIRQIPTCTAFIDKECKVAFSTDIWSKIFCGTNKFTEPYDLFSIFPEVNEKWKKQLKTSFAGSTAPMGIHKYTDQKGEESWYSWKNVPWYDSSENIIGIILTLEDVTDAINTDIEFVKTKNLLTQQSEISKTGIWEFNVKKDILTWCSMTKRIHEVGHDYMPTFESSFGFYKEGHNRNVVSMAIHQAAEKGLCWSLKVQITTAKGNDKWVMASGKPTFSNNKLVGYIGTFQDIHSQVTATLESQKKEKLLRTLVDNLPLNVYIKDLDSRKVLINKAELDYMGASHYDEVLGKTDFDLYPNQTAKWSREEDMKIYKTLRPILGKETYNYKKDGSKTAFLTSKIPLIDESGAAYGLVGISMDITHIKQKENELRHLINVTTQQNKKLVDFAHIVSHNLRSHSANFSMLLDFLSNEKDEKEKTRIIEMLSSASGNLMETLENLNEVIAITTHLNADKAKLKLTTKIKEVSNTMRSYLLEHQVRLINKVDPDIMANAVPEYLENILINFITNAARYRHPKRKPVIEFNARKDKFYTVLSVTDNGLGIDLKKYKSKLFGMYKTFHSHKNARGIGLYIVKNQIEAMNGKITVDSKVGHGTKFEIYFDDRN